jgi:flagellin-specific chaperone FliS
MAKPNGKKRQTPRQKKSAIPILRVKKGATLKEIYAAVRRQFTAADLQKFTEIEEGIPAVDVLKDLEDIYQEAKAKQKKTKNAQPRK